MTKAKIKAFEDRPEWARCCDKTIGMMNEFPEMEVDLNDTTISPGECAFCAKEKPVELVFVRIPSMDCYIELDLLDLETTVQ